MTRYYVMRGPSSAFWHYVDSDDLDRTLCGRRSTGWIIVPAPVASCFRCNDRRNKNA